MIPVMLVNLQEGLEDKHSFIVQSCICSLWLVLQLKATCSSPYHGGVWVVKYVLVYYGGTGEWE